MTHKNRATKIELPIGGKMRKRITNVEPILEINFERYVVHDSTDKEWPTVVEANKSSGEVLGIAILYWGHLQDSPIHEVDAILSSDTEQWRTIVAYQDKNVARRYVQTDHEEYGMPEFIDSTEASENRIEATIECGRTPVVYTEERPYHTTTAFQRGDSFDSLAGLFGIGWSTALADRIHQVRQLVSPSEETWESKKTDAFENRQRIYKSILDKQSDNGK
ncbi:hypothetical protein [Candidatus Halobonum tyrrellensis]|uniref:hypothetical protein n=1 Tax=Candidatus Halobonum tyrrellensis TaxID=1431545 RepID=UPI001268A0F0|nr:hypothetical protein [Candidatus Halobonum tyrrellensis]